MKTVNLVLVIFFLVNLVFMSCNKTEDNEPEQILPTCFKVEIPSSLSNNSGVTLKSGNGDTLRGGEIYAHLRTFVFVGESAANMVQLIIKGICAYQLSRPIAFSFTSEEDNRVKNLEVIENSEFEGYTYQYQLTITDALSETEADGGMAMQVFWDKNPIKGVSILKPYNINRTNPDKQDSVIFRVDYCENGENGYSHQMRVCISGMTLEDPIRNRFSISTMKMFVGRKGNVVELCGNSNHPNAYLYENEDPGFNWAFVAAGNETTDEAVAEVALPPSVLNSNNRTEILKTYSIKNVFSQRISNYIYHTWGFHPTNHQLEPYLHNTNAPGYFNHGGFVAAGSAPNGNYSELERTINNLSPYNPITVTNLRLSFKQRTQAK